MAQVKFIKHQTLEDNKNNTVWFESELERDTYFDNLPTLQYPTVSLNNDEVRDLQNIWDLTNEITVHDQRFYDKPSRYNYVIIKNGNNPRKYYFFITGFKQHSVNSVSYRLKLDTLTTYASINNGPFRINHTPQLVLREHRDRWNINKTTMYDKTIEALDIQPSKTTLLDTARPWNDNRVRLSLSQESGKFQWLLYTETPVSYDFSTVEQDVKGGYGFDNATIKYEGTVINAVEPLVKSGVGGLQYCYWGVYETASHFYLHVFEKESGYPQPFINRPQKITDFITITGDAEIETYRIGIKKKNNVTTMTSTEGLIYSGVENPMVGSTNTKWNNLTLISSGVSNYTTKTFIELDVTDPINKNIKELPYLPDQTPKWNGTSLYYDANQTLSVGDIVVYEPQRTFDKSFDMGRLYIKGNDPKIFTSQFHPLFVSWFGEMKDWRVESNLNGLNIINNLIMYDTSNMNGGKWFYGHDEYELKAPYETTVNMDFNNSVATLSSDLDQYNRYLKDDDLKMMQIQQTKANISSAMSVVNQTLGIIPGTSEGSLSNPLSTGTGAIRAVRSVVNIGNEIAQSALDTKSRQLTYDQKMMNLKLGGITISGGNPSMNHIDNNDKITLWQVSPQEFEVDYLSRYFHKYGYETLEYKDVRMKTRRRWDYKKIIVDEMETDAEITEEVKKDITSRFSEGITFFHPVDGIIDWSQRWENWEVR